MTIYVIDGIALNTENVAAEWTDSVFTSENGYISRATGSNLHREILYLTPDNNFFLLHKSGLKNQPEWVEPIEPYRAARWLALNLYTVDANLKDEIGRMQPLIEMDERECAQYLADHYRDVCSRCNKRGRGTCGLCLEDVRVPTCLMTNEPGAFNGMNYSIDTNFPHDDFRRYRFAGRLSWSELCNEFRKGV